MYLFSVSESESGGPYVMTRIFRKMHNLRMSYTIESSDNLDINSDAASIASLLSSKYNDRSYTIINPRFSQVGRPTVKVEMKPRIFISSATIGMKTAEILRKSLIPVETISIEESGVWEKTEGHGFGGDHRVPGEDLILFLTKLYSEKRIFFSDDFNMPEIKDIISQSSFHPQGEISACLFSIAMSVWIGEHQKQLKTHSSGGRVKI